MIDHLLLIHTFPMHFYTHVQCVSNGKNMATALYVKHNKHFIINVIVELTRIINRGKLWVSRDACDILFLSITNDFKRYLIMDGN